jgi:hypothetical protein
MYEHRSAPLVPLPLFFRRLLKTFALVGGLVGASLGIGVVGYHTVARLPWIDALLDASMILAGMGPVSPLPTDGAKVFASIYALFSGVVFISSIGLAVAPLAHRFLHEFHLESKTPRRG